MKTKLLLFVFLLTNINVAISQTVINGYAQVTGITGSSTFNVSNVNESGDSFEVGEKLIIMQMQDDVIGANTADNSSFGNLGSIQSAGLYEIAEIASIVESGGTPTSITVLGTPGVSYNTGSNSRLQLITFPTFGTPNYTTTSNVRAMDWNGDVGGVVAFEVDGILTLAHSISANGRGFNGAAANSDFSSTGCSGGANYRLASTAHFADKGEGIYRSTLALYQAGQGKILNGGGGGNSHNGGGGGGGNFSAGGQGGPGWPNCSPSAGGLGGLDLSANISASRVFLGGGGGSGEGNNGSVVNGGDGGGIILIKANEIRTTGACGGISIVSDGLAVAPTTGGGNDGNSGAGAGGSIVLEVPTWSIAGTCPLTVQANGGNGGNVNHSASHGGGGGGGMGAIIFSSTTPTTNVTVNNSAGSGGLNCGTCSPAPSGSGTSGSGVIDSSSGVLPVTLTEFKAIPNVESKVVNLFWVTTSEINNDYFTVEKTKDLKHYEQVIIVQGKGTTNEKSEYQETDFSPYSGVSYYRLSQTDFDGKTEFFTVKEAKFDNEDFHIQLYPNPNNGHNMYLKVKVEETEEINLLVNDFLGKDFLVDFMVIREGEYALIAIEMAEKLEPGTYLVNLQVGKELKSHKLIVR